jgi:hypothetical protein
MKKRVLILSALVLASLISISTINPGKDFPGESEIVLEEWMTVPFVETLDENPLELEDWMLEPFQIN